MMVTPGTVVIGGLVGAVIGVFWSNPYRDSAGRYTTRSNGFSSWIFQAVAGGVVGAIVTPFVFSLLIASPLVVMVGLGIGLYMIYRHFVDPR